MKKESELWSEWQCETCGCNNEDPDSIKVTTCHNGHINYLSPIEGKHGKVRVAYKSAYLRSKAIREHKHLLELFRGAMEQITHPKGE